MSARSPLRRAGPLDLGDHADARRAQRRHASSGGGAPAARALISRGDLRPRAPRGPRGRRPGCRRATLRRAVHAVLLLSSSGAARRVMSVRPDVGPASQVAPRSVARRGRAADRRPVLARHDARSRVAGRAAPVTSRLRRFRGPSGPGAASSASHAARSRIRGRDGRAAVATSPVVARTDHSRGRRRPRGDARRRCGQQQTTDDQRGSAEPVAVPAIRQPSATTHRDVRPPTSRTPTRPSRRDRPRSRRRRRVRGQREPGDRRGRTRTRAPDRPRQRAGSPRAPSAADGQHRAGTGRPPMTPPRVAPGAAARTSPTRARSVPAVAIAAQHGAPPCCGTPRPRRRDRSRRRCRRRPARRRRRRASARCGSRSRCRGHRRSRRSRRRRRRARGGSARAPR